MGLSLPRMKFSMLGSMEISYGGMPLTPTAPKVRQTAALLLCRANQLVATEAMIDELWPDGPPRSAVTTTQTYIYQLRKLLARGVGNEEAGQLLLTRPPGYVLCVPDDQIDTRSFDYLVNQGKALAAQGHKDESSRNLRDALALWRGAALADVVARGPVLSAYVVHLEELRIQAHELRIRIELELGRHRDLVPDLRALVSAHPLNESFHAQLITSLQKAGRRGDALMAYQSLSRLLRDELGIEPSPPLRRLQHELLRES
jgi:SARP family transcriptional regulator, regulator of embCAB operon